MGSKEIIVVFAAATHAAAAVEAAAGIYITS